MYLCTGTGQLLSSISLPRIQLPFTNKQATPLSGLCRFLQLLGGSAVQGSTGRPCLVTFFSTLGQGYDYRGVELWSDGPWLPWPGLETEMLRAVAVSFAVVRVEGVPCLAVPRPMGKQWEAMGLDSC